MLFLNLLLLRGLANADVMGEGGGRLILTDGEGEMGKKLNAVICERFLIDLC